MGEKSIKIRDIEMDYVQCLYYEILGLELIFKNILLKNKNSDVYEFNKDNVDYYLKVLRETSIKFNTIKQELIEIYNPEWIKENVEFDFYTCEMRVNNKGCDSNVK